MNTSWSMIKRRRKFLNFTRNQNFVQKSTGKKLFFVLLNLLRHNLEIVKIYVQ